MPQFNSIFPNHIIAFTSDRSVDFSLRDDQNCLTEDQKEFLSSQINCPLAEPVAICQVHGDNILVIDEANSQKDVQFDEADGVMTQSAHVPLAVRSADCLPVFLYDQMTGGVGLIHVGWKGSQKNILDKAIKLMESKWQTDASEIKVYFGPSICSRCYEVGPEFNEYFPGELIVRDGKYYLDLQEINRNRLIHCGVLDDSIIDSELCTCCDTNYFSYRREKEGAGRMLSLIVINQ